MIMGTFPLDQLHRRRGKRIDQHPSSYNTYSRCDERLLPHKPVLVASPTIESWRYNRPKHARQPSREGGADEIWLLHDCRIRG
jgi:hypothetical protein